MLHFTFPRVGFGLKSCSRRQEGYSIDLQTALRNLPPLPKGAPMGKTIQKPTAD